VAEYTKHIHVEAYPYVTVDEMVTRCESAANADEDLILEAIEDASTVVYYLTGRQFDGVRQATVRPQCNAGCSCGCSVYQVNLGLWPITELISVRHEGTAYTGVELSDTFHVNDRRFLARNDGDALRGGNQWAIAGGDKDTLDDGYVFEATFSYGMQIPSLIKRATRALACQWVSQIAGIVGPCALPQRTTSVSRSGITMDIESAVDLLRDGRTGIYEVDLAIVTFNPVGMQSPSFVWGAQSSYKSRQINT